MNFELSEEQTAIFEMATSLFKGHCTDERLGLFDAQREPFMEDLWSHCVETGLHSMIIPDTVGGGGFGMTDVMLVMEAQGHALAQVPLWRHQLAAATLVKFSNTDNRTLLDAAVQGHLLLTTDASPRTREPRLIVSRDGTGWRVQGRVEALAQGATEARHALLTVEMEGAPQLLSVDLSAEGITIIPGRMCHGEMVADVQFVDVVCPQAALLPGTALEWLENHAIAALSALQLGVSVEQVQRAVDYVKERRQFDRTIASFQAVQMTLADMHIAIEALRTSLWQLVYRLDAGLSATAQARATAYLACETGHLVGHKAQHVHGGVGVDLSYPIHRYLYWSRALGATLGGAALNLASLGDWLADNDTLGWKYDLEEEY